MHTFKDGVCQDVSCKVSHPIRMNDKVDLRAACVAFFVISVVARRIHLLLCVRNHVRNQTKERPANPCFLFPMGSRNH